jgi:hypothetical protein
MGEAGISRRPWTHLTNPEAGLLDSLYVRCLSIYLLFAQFWWQPSSPRAIGEAAAVGAPISSVPLH